MKEMIKRIPRPQGTTMLQQKHKKKSITKKHIIDIYIRNNFVICNKQLTIQQFSMIYNISQEEIHREIQGKMGGMGRYLRNTEELNVTLLSGLQMALNWSFEDRMAVQNQVALLLDSQGDSYKAFISSEVTKGLKLLLDSTSNQMQLLRTLGLGDKGPTTNILVQQNSTAVKQEVKALSADDAIKLLAQEGITKVRPEELEAKALEIKHGLSSIPTVSVRGDLTERIGNNHNIEYTDHDSRRVEEYNIDEDADEV